MCFGCLNFGCCVSFLFSPPVDRAISIIYVYVWMCAVCPNYVNADSSQALAYISDVFSITYCQQLFWH